jgi:hypothetical protein
MKQCLKAILAVAILIITLPTVAQTDYTIEFEQEITTTDSSVVSMIEMMGEMSSTWYIKGKEFRGETNAGMTGTTTIIYNADSKEMLMLMESPFLGNTYMKVSDTAEVEEDDFQVERTKEKRKIAGYKCVKYIATDADGTKTILYATDDIKNPFNSQYSGKIEGAILCSITVADVMGSEMTITMTATAVKKGTISEDKFSMVIPEGYTEFVDDTVSE